MARNTWTWRERDPVKQIEMRRKYREQQFRSRWLNTTMYGLCFIFWGLSIWHKRAQWSSLLHLYTWTHHLSLGGLVADVLVFGMWVIILGDTWHHVYVYRQEQAALEQQRLMQDAANAPGVWPPPPHKPKA